MKKMILFALLFSLLILVGGYYYFYILHPLDVEPKLPTKQRIVIQKPITSVQQKSVAKVDVKKEQPREVKKEEPKKVELQKTKEPKIKEPIKEAVQTKETMKPTTTIEKKEDKKEVAKREEKKRPAKKTKGYSLVYVVSSSDEALKIKNELTEKGYHTAKTGKYGSRDAIIVSPFTDKWEAEYVLKNIVKDTGIKHFKVVAIY
jgi:hypothetical protein